MLAFTPNSATATITTTRSTVSNQSYVLITSGGAAVTVSQWKANTDNLVGSFVVSPNTMMVLVKSEYDTINATPSVAATAVKPRI
jgi:hypothetical protein